MVRFAAMGWLVACAPAAAHDARGDLRAAFEAVFHASPPLASSVEGGVLPSGETERVATELVPVRVARLSRDREALVVTEDILNHGWSQQGFITIAYLRRHGRGWIVERVWHRLATAGSFGQAAQTIQVVRFGSQPLVLAFSELCGTSGCNTDVAVFALGRRAPRFLGAVPGRGSKDSEGGPTSCEDYGFTARFGRAASPRNVLSVRYSGWTAPAEALGRRHWFRRKADIAVLGDHLVLRPHIVVPECGR